MFSESLKKMVPKPLWLNPVLMNSIRFFIVINRFIVSPLFTKGDQELAPFPFGEVASAS